MKSKIKIFILMFCLITWHGIFYEKEGTKPAWGQDVNDLIRQGRKLLNFNLPAAKDRFQKAVEIQPTNQEANFFLAITRLLLLLQNEQVSLIQARLGFLSPLVPPKALPPDSPSGKEFQILLRDTILPNIEKSLANLSVINESFKTILKPEEIGSKEDAEVDFGDVAFSKAVLNAISSFIQILSAYDFDIRYR